MPPPSDVPSDWIPDPTALRRAWLKQPADLDEDLCEDLSVNGKRAADTNKKLFREAPIRAAPFVERSGPRLLCIVYTMSENHGSNLKAIADTWGPGCDGFVAFSTASEPSLNAISIPHDGKEEYMNMWQKVRSIWRFVHRRVGNG